MAFYGKQLESLANGVNINMTNLTLPAVLKNKSQKYKTFISRYTESK